MIVMMWCNLRSINCFDKNNARDLRGPCFLLNTCSIWNICKMATSSSIRQSYGLDKWVCQIILSVNARKGGGRKKLGSGCSLRECVAPRLDLTWLDFTWLDKYVCPWWGRCCDQWHNDNSSPVVHRGRLEESIKPSGKVFFQFFQNPAGPMTIPPPRRGAGHSLPPVYHHPSLASSCVISYDILDIQQSGNNKKMYDP